MGRVVRARQSVSAVAITPLWVACEASRTSVFKRNRTLWMPTEDVFLEYKYLKDRIDQGHCAVLEHINISFKMVTSRAIANELTRHRHASFVQESTRYVAYNDTLHIIDGASRERTMATAERCFANYLDALASGCAPEDARDLLPLCTATHLFATANLREWRLIYKLRTSRHAHPVISDLMGLLIESMTKKATPDWTHAAELIAHPSDNL